MPVCPVHFLTTLHVSMSHNLTAPSWLPLTTFFPSGDNAILHTPQSPSLQSSPICFPLFVFHTRSEPSPEQVMIRCPPGRCMAPQTIPVCPSNFWRCVIADVSFFLVAVEDIIRDSYYRVRRHLSFYPSNSKINTHENSGNDNMQAAENNGYFGQVRVESIDSWCVFNVRYPRVLHSLHTA
jgi:hypothetical protein